MPECAQTYSAACADLLEKPVSSYQLAPLPPLLYVPRGHTWQEPEPPTRPYPTRHVPQLEDPAPVRAPVGQAWQVVVAAGPPAEYSLAAHMLQLPGPAKPGRQTMAQGIGRAQKGQAGSRQMHLNRCSTGVPTANACHSTRAPAPVCKHLRLLCSDTSP